METGLPVRFYSSSDDLVLRRWTKYVSFFGDDFSLDPIAEQAEALQNGHASVA
jgi:hypothetical protein